QPTGQSNSVTDRFNQVLERLTLALEQSYQPAEPSNRLSERLDQFFDRFNQVAEQSSQPADQLAERSNQLAERSNQLMERSSQSAEQSNKHAERFNEFLGQLNGHLGRSGNPGEELPKSVGKLGDVLKNINKVLVGIQHAIVRNHKGNTLSALDCLVNEQGDTPVASSITSNYSIKDFLHAYSHVPVVDISLTICDVPQQLSLRMIRNSQLLLYRGRRRGGRCQV
ncbi:hypothetical protein FRC11_001095, partial [Ceratobasidium sp. 423]